MVHVYLFLNRVIIYYPEKESILGKKLSIFNPLKIKVHVPEFNV